VKSFRLFIALVLLLCAGCVVLPTPEMTHRGSRSKTVLERGSSIRPGVTSKEEVLLQFGEPDAVGSQENRFLYWAAVGSGIWGIGSYPPFFGNIAEGHLTVDIYFLSVEFDQKEIVAERELQTKKIGPTTRAGTIALVREEMKQWMAAK
jgi:hypothetical protein